MAKKKPPKKQLPPIDFSSDEWLVFDWRNQVVHRNLQLGSESTTEPMPKRFHLPGCQIIRTDTGEPVTDPISYSTVLCFLVFGEPFWGKTQSETVRCEIIPAKSA